MRSHLIKYILMAIVAVTLIQNVILYCLLFKSSYPEKSRTVHLCGPEIWLRTVRSVTEKFGFVPTNDMEQADLVWGLNCPWDDMFLKMKTMGFHQRFNKIPGLNAIVKKSQLSTKGFPFVPKTFLVPRDAHHLKAFVKNHPKKLFLTKHPHQHVVSLINPSDVPSWQNEELLIQELIHPPYLVGGYKFDLTMYVLITSINPLRVYTNKKLMLRFCPNPYHEFQADPISSSVDSYVIRDHDFAHAIWIPGVKNYTTLRYPHHAALAAYIRDQGQDPDVLFLKMKQMVLDVILESLPRLRRAAEDFPKAGNSSFFQLTRWDFVLDDNLQPYLLEANGSPDLGRHIELNVKRSSRYLFDAFHMMDLGSLGGNINARERDFITTVELMARPEQCLKCHNACQQKECRICFQCISPSMLDTLYTVYVENQNRGTYQRLFPLPRALAQWTNFSRHSSLVETDGQLQDWFNAMCERDNDFC
ncbi:probable tubulin polyglutamylase ttll-15 [Tigriopus californicus]|uniref:probable tubulin polyglutamylase ttll-15 n=1 Tax=Tigriopus californicus TaxID=6832 RepID=UPI0027DA690A|nr:probable tubulin polyglutamylase ttll-15 [Tigriopus californicus]